MTTISRLLCMSGLWGKVARRQPYLTKKYIQLGFILQKHISHLKSPRHMWEFFLWSNETKIELYGHNSQTYIWGKNNTAHHQKNTIPPVTCGGSIMLWGCFFFRWNLGGGNYEHFQIPVSVGTKPLGFC